VANPTFSTGLTNRRIPYTSVSIEIQLFADATQILNINCYNVLCYQASENGYAEIVSILLQNGAAVDCLAAATQSTALILACAEGHEEVVQILIRAGADVNAANCYGNTGLHEACRQGYKTIAEMLLAHKASATQSNHKGSSALHFLCYGESATDHPISLAKKLVEAGADVNARDHRGVTPLLACCTSGR
jgi:ankyrin repeat protein